MEKVVDASHTSSDKSEEEDDSSSSEETKLDTVKEDEISKTSADPPPRSL
jgi:hypothetical protein